MKRETNILGLVSLLIERGTDGCDLRELYPILIDELSEESNLGKNHMKLDPFDEEEYKDNFEQADVECAANVEPEGSGADAGKIVRSGRPVNEADGPGKGGGCEYSDEDGAAHLPNFQ